MKPVISNPATPADEIAAIDKAKAGDDDHPAYSDRQLSEAMVARDDQRHRLEARDSGASARS